MTVRPFGSIKYKTKEELDEEVQQALARAKAMPQASLLEDLEESPDAQDAQDANDSFFF